jgi:hypothetical protein
VIEDDVGSLDPVVMVRKLVSFLFCVTLHFLGNMEMSPCYGKLHPQTPCMPSYMPETGHQPASSAGFARANGFCAGNAGRNSAAARPAEQARIALSHAKQTNYATNVAIARKCKATGEPRQQWDAQLEGLYPLSRCDVRAFPCVASQPNHHRKVGEAAGSLLSGD